MYADEDDNEVQVTREWLTDKGWDEGIHWPNTWTALGQLLEWRDGRLWIENTPIADAETRGELCTVAWALGCEWNEK